MSKSGELNKADWIGWFNRTKQTLAPYVVALLVPFLLELLPIVIKEIPPSWEYAVVTVWILQRVYDLLRRYKSGTK